MGRLIIGLGAVVLLCFVAAFAGDFVYQWVDENGVRHYSDVPPGGDQEVTVTRAVAGSQSDSESAQGREKFDKMVDNINKETAASEAGRKRKEKAEEQRKRREAEEMRRARNAEEREKILKKIEMLKKRAVSPTFTEGMRKAQLEKLEARLRQLK